MKKIPPKSLKDAGAIAPAMGCIRLLVEDMYAGLSSSGEVPEKEAFRRATVSYLETKFQLCPNHTEPVLVDERTFFLLKKCVYHWVQGIRLALQCAGMDSDSAVYLAAEGCRQMLTADAEPDLAAAACYGEILSAPIRAQYAMRGTIPSDTWCAWVELEAAKTAAMALHRKENYD